MIAVATRISTGYRGHQVFSSLSLGIPVGITALLGPNGAGKTTLMTLLTGLRQPRVGQVTVLGHDMGTALGRRSATAELGYLPQSFGYYPRYRVRDFVAMAAWLKKVPADRIGPQCDRALADVGLSDRADSRMKSLSGGMLRRAGIAQAIVHRPRLLLLDEPSAGLDPQQRVALRRLVMSLAGETSIVISTHLVDDVSMMASQLLILNDGAIRFAGSPAELAARADAKVDGDSPLERGYSAVLAADPAISG